MPIRNCPILSMAGNDTTIILPIKIINPKNNSAYPTYGLIDTGATECAIPAPIANILGHVLVNGNKKPINTGNGTAQAYSHLSTIEIYHPAHLNHPHLKPIYIIDNVLIDFMPNLPVPLLGVKGFLGNFELTINYPKRIFSLVK